MGWLINFKEKLNLDGYPKSWTLPIKLQTTPLSLFKTFWPQHYLEHSHHFFPFLATKQFLGKQKRKWLWLQEGKQQSSKSRKNGGTDQSAALKGP